MLTLKFYAGGDDAPPRLPVRVLSGVTDVRLSDENPPRLVYSTPSPGLVSLGRDDVSYLPLNGAVVEVLEGGVSLAHLNAGPEVLTIPASFKLDDLTPDQRRRMQGDREPTWPVGLTPPGVIDTVGGFPALALALQKEGYSFGSLTEGFGWWFGKWTEAAERGDCGAADTLRQAILGAEEQYRDRAEREPGDVGAAMRTRAGTILDRARRDDCIAPHKPLHARRIPLDLARAADAHHDSDSLAADTPPLHSQSGRQQGLGKPASRIFPPVPAEDWLSVDCYPSNWLDRGERLAVMVEDDAGNVGRAFKSADGTWWSDLPADATPEQLEFEPVRFSYLPAPHRFACRTCFAWLGKPHVEGCPNVQPGQVRFVLMGDTPPAERAPVDTPEPRRRNAAWFEGAMKWAENLIVQLPPTHDGRNSWLLNHGLTAEAVDIQDRRAAYDPGFAEQLARRRQGQVEPAEFEAETVAALPGEGWAGHNPYDFGGRRPCGPDDWVQVAGADRVASAPVKASERYWGAGDDCDNPIRFWRPAPADLVPVLVDFTVDGQSYDTTPGVRSGRALYDRVGGLSGMMLVAPDGKFVGDTDLVDIQGGEVFATTSYRDPVLRPDTDPAVPPGHVVVTLNGMTKAVDPVAVTFVDDLWRVLQLSSTSGLKVNKPGQVTRPLPDPNAAYKVEKGDAFESYLCERRFSRAAPVQITVDGSHRLLTPGEYTRQEIDVLFGSGGWVLTKNGAEIGSGNPVTVELGDTFTTDIPF